jgi:hypothetical protein
MLQPVSAFSGGLINNPCLKPSLADLAKPADSADGAAARVKADEMAAKERRAAVRYLGTVECNRWPEAEMALINSLRGDRNECVRLEAAWVLGRGCCCTPKIVAALSLTVSGSDRDGFPVERSERVRAVALASLNHCLACLAPQVPVPMGELPVQDKKGGEKEVPPGQELPLPQTVKPATHSTTAPKDTAKAATPELKQINFYAKVEYKDIAPLIQKAKAAQQQTAKTPVSAVQQQPVMTSASAATPRPGGLFAIVGTAFNPAANGQGQQVVQTAGVETSHNYGLLTGTPPTPATIGTVSSPYHTSPVAPQASSSSNTDGQTSGNRGLLPALFNRNRGVSSAPETPVLVSPQVILGEPVSGPEPRVGQMTSPSPSTPAIPVTVAPASRTNTVVPPALPAGNSNVELAPRSIDQILGSPGR